MPSLIGPKGKAGLLRVTPGAESGGAQTEAQGDKGTSPHGDRGGPKETGASGASVVSSKATTGGKRTDYEKRGYYVGLRHQETLDDLARELRRLKLPDDRSMIVRALIDVAGEELKEEGGQALIEHLASACRKTMPGTTKAQGD